MNFYRINKTNEKETVVFDFNIFSHSCKYEESNNMSCYNHTHINRKRDRNESVPNLEATKPYAYLIIE
jgi:hypothetical protein